MKRTLAMVTAVLMASASAPAFAGDAMKMDTEAKSGANAGIESNADANLDGGADLGIDVETTASTSSAANFGSVISSIRTGGFDAAAISDLDDTSEVSIVHVDSLTGAADEPQALENALEENQDQVDQLRTAFATELETNADLQAMFDDESVTSDDVVAAETEADGAVTIYVR